MRRTSFAASECPIARALEVVGEWWSLLILRDAFRGKRRFEEFQASLGIARNMLSRRLTTLVRAGILEKRPYGARPPRHEYRLTEKGRDLFPVLITLMDWGNQWAAQGAPTVLLIDRVRGAAIEPVLTDRGSGMPIEPRGVTLIPGPGAGPETRTMLGAPADDTVEGRPD